jgi:SAM-dependent methyltransferase
MMKNIKGLPSYIRRSCIYQQIAKSTIKTLFHVYHNSTYAKTVAQIDERYFDRENKNLKVTVRPRDPYPFTTISAHWNGNTFEAPLCRSHLGLAKMVTDYSFSDVLEIGSRHGVAAQLFKFLGKELTTIEIDGTFSSDISGNYVKTDFGKQFDAIWCSHVLEHQRHPGHFIDKLFSDLKEGGVLGLTVPSALSPLMLGHFTIWTPLHLIYNLIGAGFDCRDVRCKNYDWQFTILLQKLSHEHPQINVAETPEMQGKLDEIGYVPEVLAYFPPILHGQFTRNWQIWGEIDAINWD